MTPDYSRIHDVLFLGSLIIAVASGLLVGAAGGATPRPRRAGRFLLLSCAIGAAAVAAQYVFWRATSSGTSTVHGLSLPSAVARWFLWQGLAMQALALATASWVVRPAGHRVRSLAAAIGQGGLGALAGAVVGSVLPTLVGIVTVAGCFVGVWQCNPLMQL